MKAEKFPAGWVVKRMQALIAAYTTESWVTNKGYTALLDKLANEFEPAKREKEREEAFTQACALEREPGKRADARAAYEALAKRAAEDNSASVWPRAAEYRLKWWTD